MAMKITWLGHSCFKVERGEYAVVIDPFEPGSVPGFGDIDEKANLVLCSHEHHDHNYRAGVTIEEKECPLEIEALESFHDDKEGSLRGPNIIHIISGDGVKIAHMGDIGCIPDESIIEKLKGVDALLLPVGGHYTVGPKEAGEIADAVNPRVTIPMHYRGRDFGFDVIGPVEDFLEQGKHWVRYPGNTIEIKPGMPVHIAVLQGPKK